MPQHQHFGPEGSHWNVRDDHSFESVEGDQCHGHCSKTICLWLRSFLDNLNSKTFTASVTYKFFVVCIPCFDEDIGELEKTIVSLIDCFNFMKHRVRASGDDFGKGLEQHFATLIPVIVPIFDGLSPVFFISFTLSS
jgi:hypothetical protein